MVKEGSSKTDTKSEGLKKEWIIDKDASPLATVIVFDKDHQECGHRLPLVKLVQRLQLQPQATCPLCSRTIAFVEDGLFGKKESVRFKYGKVAYGLSVVDALQTHGRPWWAWFPPFSLFTEDEKGPTTVQGRISSVLGLEGRVKVQLEERAMSIDCRK